MTTDAAVSPRLPAGDPSTVARALAFRHSAAPTRAVRVLVIDDDDVLLDVVGRALRATGFQVFTATSAEEGLDRFETLRPDCAIVDVYLPGLDGFAFVERAHAIAPDVPLLMLSGLEGIENERRAAVAGARRFLPKAIDVRDLARHVHEAIATPDPNAVPEMAEHRASPVASEVEPALPTLNLGELERRAIDQALALAKGNRTKAARLLGVHVRTLHRRLQEHGER